VGHWPWAEKFEVSTFPSTSAQARRMTWTGRATSRTVAVDGAEGGRRAGRGFGADRSWFFGAGGFAVLVVGRVDGGPEGAPPSGVMVPDESKAESQFGNQACLLILPFDPLPWFFFFSQPGHGGIKSPRGKEESTTRPRRGRRTAEAGIASPSALGAAPCWVAQ